MEKIPSIVPSLPEIVADRSRKYRNFQIVYDHGSLAAFFAIENTRLALEHIVLRALSYGKNEEQLPESHESPALTYHWITMIGLESGKPQFNHIKYKPSLRIPSHNFILSNTNPRDHREFTFEQYFDFKYSTESGFKVKPYVKNIIEKPDGPTRKLVERGKQMITGMLAENPEVSNAMEHSCKKAIKNRFNELCKTAYLTHNNYYLKKANFWRKLEYSMLSDDHRLLMAGALAKNVSMEVLEYELRNAYDEQISGTYTSSLSD